MTTLTAAPASVTTKSRRRGLPLWPHRIAPRPFDAPFAAGLLVEAPAPVAETDPESSYSLSSILPKTCGFGLTGEEHDRVANARNRTRAAYKADCPTAPYREVERVAEQAAKDEMRRVLRERPSAVAVEVKAEAAVVAEPAPVAASAKPVSVRFDAAKLAPAPAKRPSVRPRLESRPIHTPADESWWASHSPSNRLGFFVEGGVDPYDTYANTMPATEYRELVEAACFGEPVDLSDDFGCAFGTGGVE